jgi:Tfp pilus assembly protein PilN
MPRLEINLLPARKQLLSPQTRSFLVVFVAIFLVLVLIDFGLQGILSSTQGQLDRIKAQAAVYAPLDAALTKLDQQEKQMQSQERYIAGLLQKQKDWSTVLVNLARDVPTQVHLTSVAVDANGKMTLQGSAPSLIGGIQFLSLLVSTPGYTQVNMDSIAQSDTGWPFTITCQLAGMTP